MDNTKVKIDDYSEYYGIQFKVCPVEIKRFGGKHTDYDRVYNIKPHLTDKKLVLVSYVEDDGKTYEREYKGKFLEHYFTHGEWIKIS